MGIGAVANIQGILDNRFRCRIQLPVLAEIGDWEALGVKYGAILGFGQGYIGGMVSACCGRLKKKGTFLFDCF